MELIDFRRESTLTARRNVNVVCDEGDATDEQLLCRYADGDVEAFEAFVGRHEAAVATFARYAIGHADLARDATQEIFLKVIRHAERFEPTGSAKAWLFTIARRHVSDVRRRIARQATDATAIDVSPLGNRPDAPDDKIGHDELKTLVQRAVCELPERQRQVVLMHRSGLSYAEIADALEISHGAVKFHMSKARERLRLLLAPVLEAYGVSQ